MLRNLRVRSHLTHHRRQFEGKQNLAFRWFDDIRIRTIRKEVVRLRVSRCHNYGVKTFR